MLPSISPNAIPPLITRIQRGDMDILANGNSVLELGDRVLVVSRRDDLPKLSKLFGNSYEALSHINLLSFGSGMALGLLLGMVNFELPNGLTFNLGFAGGPLIVGLILGALRRSGPIVWTLPYSASLTLRQMGLILLLAGIGIRSGHTFLNTLLQGDGWLLFPVWCRGQLFDSHVRLDRRFPLASDSLQFVDGDDF